MDLLQSYLWETWTLVRQMPLFLWIFSTKGLVKLLNKQEVQVCESSRNPYSAGASKAASLSTVNKSSSLKEKIGRMFHLNTPGERRERSSEFEPVASFSKAKKGRY